ncbi:hypothetical protein EV382_2890 [Micromonospora violae]|uniref:Uncharacterized protein n=1 Tax=Micromonospora violae TaxID=1278207 RepID=A0A4Q7UEV3_9ACTN|nr:hypothetical protein [Micromonospora violae]RZT79666.1 hypothetical protein EV382_2890 [Micromonospora violae]
MILPFDHQHQQRKEPDPPTGAAPDKRLDQPRQDNGSWMVGNIDGRTTTHFINVEAPRQPPELHPGAAAALLKLLRRVNDHRTDNSIEEDG